MTDNEKIIAFTRAEDTDNKLKDIDNSDILIFWSHWHDDIDQKSVKEKVKLAINPNNLRRFAKWLLHSEYAND